ncbi:MULTISPECIES: secretion protein EspA [Burkholderia]|uniref:Secretion protein EspA n=1 Tax=Burkholderia mayonis TaxID=1385591 RepID=A0A1B4FM74_9BURK|nr:MULTISPECIES: secretion protein EspA [Burkholderia]AOJ04763.1 secretion protein EspA [Burkholderia mayonis]KVE36812.1 secretion protein EspA [Burkholderia sp. BDU5]KVE41300.1 secretion protein EspA [Burkholderia mayonis]
MTPIQSTTQTMMHNADSVGGGDNRNVANPHPIGDSIAMMLVIMDLLSRQTTAKLDDMQKKSNISRDAQDMANKAEAALAKLIKPEDKTELPGEVLKYMKDNNILVNGKTIDDFMKDKGGKLDKADLMSVKSSLESVSGRASDFVQQSQLKMQQLMQNYNTAVQMINSLQSMLAESTKGIASAIR